MNNQLAQPLPMHKMLRQRREELNLHQADIAEALDVTPEAVGMWESARRRMSLDKIPALADILELHRRDLCVLWFYEFYPLCYAEVFGKDAPQMTASTGLFDF